MLRDLSQQKPLQTKNTGKENPLNQLSGMDLSAKKIYIYKRALANINKNPFDTHSQELLVCTRKEYRRTCRNAESSFRKTMLNKLLSIESNNPKQFWKLIKNMKEWGQDSQDPSDCIPSTTWEEHFRTLLNSPTSQTLELPIHQKLFIPEMDRRISERELTEAIMRTKLGKACGPDGILIEHIKHATDDALHTLLNLMNIIFSNAIYPKSWSSNYLKPIYKKGSKENPDNYRGLAIGSVVSKLYSTILLQRLESFTDSNRTITPNQIGFRKGHRTADHIFVLKSLITKLTRQKNRKLFVAFIDFKKAYDTVNRTTLLERLNSTGISNKLLINLKAMYSNINYMIKTSNNILKPLPSNLGLKQGCPLSPLLFNIYINDFHTYLQAPTEPNLTLHGTNINHFLYADDLVILSETKEGLQGHLDSLCTFARDKSLTVNTHKSKIMIFNKSGRQTKEHFMINEKELEVVRSFTYLGIDISTSGSFTLGIKELTAKAKKAMMPLYKTVMQFQMPFRQSLKLFQTYVEPILLYNAENWSSMTDKQIDKCKNNHTSLYELALRLPSTTTQLKYSKFILGLSKQCPNMAVLGEVAEIPVALKGYLAMLKFWHRIRYMSDDTLVKKAYQENVLMNSNWCKTIQILNCSQNLHCNPPSIKDFPKIAKLNIANSFTAYWKSRITDQNIEKKLRTYARVKHSFQTETYLALPSFKDRQAITKFICSDHKLEIEIGRHRNIPREDRLCRTCDLRKVENEDHFLLECPQYSGIRNTIFGEPQENINIEEIFANIPTYNLAKYLNQALKLRDTALIQQKENYCIVRTSLTGLKITLRKMKSHETYLPQRLRPLRDVVKTNDVLKFKIVRD